MIDKVFYFPLNIVFVIVADNVWYRLLAASVLAICYYMKGHHNNEKSMSGGYAAAHGMGDD